jgi:hypothetical protein
MAEKDCGRLVLRQGGIDISRDGKLLVSGWDGENDRESCCGYEFTIRFPSDAIGSTSGTYNERDAGFVQSQLQSLGRKIGVICAGTYDIFYVSGTTSQGCGGLVCSCYANYVVTPLGPLSGHVGDQSGSSNNEAARTRLEQLKGQPTRYSSPEKQDFKVGFWPVHYNAYSNGSMTWKIVPVSGMVLEWNP